MTPIGPSWGFSATLGRTAPVDELGNNGNQTPTHLLGSQWTMCRFPGQSALGNEGMSERQLGHGQHDEVRPPPKLIRGAHPQIHPV